MVMGGDSCSEGRGFETRRHTLGGHKKHDDHLNQKKF